MEPPRRRTRRRKAPAASGARRARPRRAPCRRTGARATRRAERRAGPTARATPGRDGHGAGGSARTASPATLVGRPVRGSGEPPPQCPARQVRSRRERSPPERGEWGGARVSPLRRCSKTACGRQAVATLTYVYADSTAVVGPLATYAEPHSYDLCDEHADRLTAPRGWEVVRLDLDAAAPVPSVDDLEALADAVREAARPPGAAPPPAPDGEVGRRGHLRVLRPPP